MRAFFRSLFSWVMWVILTLILGPTVGLTALFSHRAGFRVSRFWSRLLLKTAGIAVEVEGREKIRAGVPAVYVSNHHSYVDVISLIAYFPVSLIFLAKKTLLFLPGLNVGMWLQGHLFVSRSRPAAGLRKMRTRGVDYLKNGQSVLVFPLGGRSWDSSVGEFKSGAAALAIWARAPVVPLSVSGSHEALPRGNWPLKPGRVIISVGEPIETEGVPLKRKREITRAARIQVESLKARADASLARFEKSSDNHSS